MSFIFFLVLIAVVSVVEISALKKKAASAPARGQAAARAKPVPPSRPAAPAAPAAPTPAQTDVRIRGTILPAEAPVGREPFVPAQPIVDRGPFAAAQPFEAHEGADEEGCVGGSMEHGHEEGESMVEHTEHMERRLEADRQTALSLQLAQKERSEKLAALRTAVVMSEVLGKPKALRPRGGFARR